jgi:hypothetical protein
VAATLADASPDVVDTPVAPLSGAPVPLAASDATALDAGGPATAATQPTANAAPDGPRRGRRRRRRRRRRRADGAAAAPAPAQQRE